MVDDAEKFAAEDHERREAAEARNAADQMAYQVDKFVTDNGDKIPEAEKAELTKVNDELKDVLKDEAADAEKLRDATDATLNVFQRIGQAMVQNSQAEAGPQGDAPAGGEEPQAAPESDDDVVEGEIVDEGEAS